MSTQLVANRRRRRIGIAAALLGVAAALPAVAEKETPASAEPLGIERALALAIANSPRVAAAAIEIRRAEAELAGARVYPFNPSLEASRARRDDGEAETHDREIGLSQELELGGQRGKRIAVATSLLEAARLRGERARQEVVAAVSTAFVEALRARELARLARFEVEIARGLAELEQRRHDAGAATLIDLNVARAAEGRAERQGELAGAAESSAKAALAEALGLVPSALPPVAGELPESLAAGQPPEDPGALALSHRSDLAALREETRAAAARLSLERAAAVPNLVLGVARGREADREDLSTLQAGITIPLFWRNQGGVAAARAGEEGAANDLALATLAVRSEAVAAASRREAAARALSVLRQAVAGTLDENLSLVQKSFSAGKLRASEVLVFRRELIDSRRELIDAAADAGLAAIAYDLATGVTVVPDAEPTLRNPSSTESLR